MRTVPVIIQPQEQEEDEGEIIRFVPRSPALAEYSETYQQGFRVADDSLDVYELYVGEDAPVDFEASGQPVATSASLPFTWSPTPPGAGTKTLHIVVRRRNKYGLRSFNVFETIKVIDTAGAEQLGPVSAPLDVAVFDGASGYLRVLATYESNDDPSPADKWEVYVKIGSNPVIGVDAVTDESDMKFAGTRSGLAVTVGPYTPGTTAHVLVVAKRDSDDERASAAVVQKVLAETIDLTDGQMFGGAAYEQR